MFTYNIKCKVRLDDLDYMGIVGNAEWLTLLTRARIEMLEAIGFPFTEMMKQKIGGVVAQANIKFLRPAFFDDQLTITISPHSPFSKGFILNYVVKNQKDIKCLSADITIIFVDQTGKSIKSPQIIKDKLFEVC